MSPTFKLAVIIASTILYVGENSALADTDLLANCGNVVEESEYKAVGGVLDEITHADLVHFPDGFLQNCHGDISYDAVINKDGVVVPVFLNHFVWCGKNNRDMNAMFQSDAWHRSIITPRLQSVRFLPPSMRGKPVCVKIHRAWLAESPNKFWSPEEWAHRK
jgi:hypothetical protein